MDNLTTIILIPVFIIILLVTYQAVQSAFNFGSAGTLVMSICVSLLSVIGMKRFLKGSLENILLPYTALGILILLLMAGLHLGRYRRKLQKRATTQEKNDTFTGQSIKSIRK